MYFVGIGEFFDPFFDMTRESRVIDVNLTGMVKTAAAVVPQMIRKGQGHFIGVSSFADELPSAEAAFLFRVKSRKADGGCGRREQKPFSHWGKNSHQCSITPRR